MAHAVIQEFEKLTPAWLELEARARVKLRTIDNERHYRAMVAFMNELLDKVGDRETHPLMGLLDIVTVFVRDYEERSVEVPDAEPAAVLLFLMRPRGSCSNTDCARRISRSCLAPSRTSARR